MPGIDPQVNITLTRLIDAAGSQHKAAKQLGISASYLHDVLTGRRTPGKKMLEALGLRKEIRYLPAREERE